MKTIYTILLGIGFVCYSWSQITEAEYFIDTDPGVGNAIAITVSPGNTINETYEIATTGLSNGFHVLHMRVKGSNNIWSLYYRDYFYIHTVSNESSVPIVAAEYFFDTDPGVNNAIDIPITEGFMVNETFAIPVPIDMVNGFHYLYIRVKDANDNWSLSIYALFEVDDELAVESFEDKKFKVFPNPITTSVNVNFNSTSNFSIEIFDLNGQKLTQLKTNKLLNTLDFSHYQNGMYLMHIVDEDTKTKKTIKVLKF